MKYTAAHVAEMVAWLAKVPCGPGGVDWEWDRDHVFHAPGEEVATAARGNTGPLTRTLTEWLRERGAYEDANGASV